MAFALAVLLAITLKQQRQLQQMQASMLQLQQRMATEGCASRGMGDAITRLQSQLAKQGKREGFAQSVFKNALTEQHRAGHISRQEQDLMSRLDG
jgi:hypothetical protein